MRYVVVDLEEVKRWRSQEALVLAVIRKMWDGASEGKVAMGRLADALGMDRATALANMRRLVQGGVLVDLTPGVNHVAHTYRLVKEHGDGQAE